MNQIYQGTSHLNCHNRNEKNVLWGQWIQNSKWELSQTIWASDFSTYSYLRRLDFPPRGLCLVNFFSNYNGNNSHCRDLGNYRKKKEREKINLVHYLSTHNKHRWDSDDFICVRMCGERQTETERLIKICFLSVLWIFFFSCVGWRFLDLRERWSWFLLEKQACDQFQLIQWKGRKEVYFLLPNEFLSPLRYF